MAEIENPCDVQTSDGPQQSSNNPRQGFIQDIREAAAQDPQTIITVEDPDEQDDDPADSLSGAGLQGAIDALLNNVEPGPPSPLLPETSEDPVKSRFLFLDGVQYKGSYSPGEYRETDFGPYSYTAPIFGTFFFRGIEEGSRFNSNVRAAHRNYFGHSARPGSRIQDLHVHTSMYRYSKDKSWGKASRLPLYAPSFARSRFDTFRYVSGKHFSYFDGDGSGLLDSYTGIGNLSGRFRYINNSPSLIPRGSNLYSHLDSRVHPGLTRATIRKSTEQENVNNFKEDLQNFELAELCSNPMYFAHKDDDIARFQPTFEKFVIDCKNYDSGVRRMRPSSRVVEDIDEGIRSGINIPSELGSGFEGWNHGRPTYQHYMKAGWSWRNYFYGFYPLLSQKHDQIKFFRKAMSEQTSPVSEAFHHPNDNLMSLMDSPQRYYQQWNELYTWYGAPPQCIFDISSMGNEKRVFDPNQINASYVEKYSENMFPIIPFWGSRYYPDEISSEDLDQHLHIQEHPVFIEMQAGRSFGYRTYKRDFINAMETTNEWSPQYLDHGLGVDLNLTNTLFSPHASNLVKPPRVGKSAIFYDMATRMPTFASKKDLESNDQPIGGYVKAEGEYNYYDEYYESNILSSIETVQDIRSLPDPYSFNFEDYQENGGSFSRSRTIQNGLNSGIVWSRYPNYEDLTDEIVKNYNIPPEPLPETQLFGSIKTKSQDFKNKYLLKNMSPMVINFELKQKTKSLLVDTLSLYNKVDFSSPLLGALAAADTTKAYILDSTDLLANREDQIQHLRSPGYDTFFEQGEQTRQDPTELDDTKLIELNDWLNEVKSSLSDPSLFSSYFERVNSSFGFLLTKNKIEDFVNKHKRSFDDIMAGKLAHSEIVGYKVEKYRLPIITGENSELVQTKYFASTNDDDLLKYFDSQVEYGRVYELKISTVLMIVGNKYAYVDGMNKTAIQKFNANGRVYLDSDDSLHHSLNPVQAGSAVDSRAFVRYDASAKFGVPGFDPSEDPKMFFGVLNKAEVIIAEIPDRTLSIAILDKPPIPPDVEVIPYKGIKNKVLFNVNSMTGEMFSKPVLLSDADADDYAFLAVNQGLEPSLVLGPTEDDSPIEDSLLHFRNDDLTLEFQIFRIDTEPTSLEDFKDNEITYIDQGTPSASYIDTIEPNKKYWYTFRTRDVHGHLSMPSNVYQVEIISDGEVTYMSSEVFIIKEKIKKIPVRPIQQFIKIEPAMSQMKIDFSENDTYQKWAVNKRLGVSDHPIWNKRFVVKIKSKTTGKEAVIKIKFSRKDGIVGPDGKIDYNDFVGGVNAAIRNANRSGGFDF